MGLRRDRHADRAEQERRDEHKYGTVSGWATHCAGSPAMRAPTANPPTGMADAMSCARHGVASGRPTAWCSVRESVAVETTIPIAIPLMGLPTSSHGRLLDTANMTALTFATPSAGTSRRRHPYQSER
jgi:hypothetical protein